MYLFNPENDLALANFTVNYTPPASAIRMAEELAVLAIWYAGEDIRIAGRNSSDTKVIAEGEINQLFLETVKKILPVQASLIPFSDTARYPHLKIIPWGWNPSLRRKLLFCGVDEQSLPSLEELICLRDYSNRRHAVEILRELQSEKTDFCGESHFFTDTEELYAWLKSLPGSKVLKMPL